MEIPTYKTYQFLHDYSLKIIEFLKNNNQCIKVQHLLKEFNYKIISKINIKTINMDYSFSFINLQEHLLNFLYECKKYKFPNDINKIIHSLQKYQYQKKHHQKM